MNSPMNAMPESTKISSLILLTSLIGSATAFPVSAQTPPVQTRPQPNPNLDQFPQPLPLPEVPPASQPIVPPNPTPSPDSSSVLISVKKIEVIGATAIAPAEIQRITQAVEGKSVTLDALRTVANAITQLYLDRGYLNSRAFVTEQEIQAGVVQIQVSEGTIGNIEIEGLQRLNSAYVRDRLKLGIGTPLNVNALEDQLRLLKADPLFRSVEASLRPGSEPGKSTLRLELKEEKAINGFLGTDNYSTPSVGAERLGGGLTYRNVTGLGDELSASYYRSAQGGSNSFDFNYRVPINAMNGTIQLRVAPSNSKIIGSVQDIRANSGLYELSYRQPVVRSPREELAFSVGLAFQEGQTFLERSPSPFGTGPDAAGNSRTRVLKLGQDYVQRDVQGVWAVRSQFNIGLGLFNATTNAEPIPDGRFFSWLGQLQRVQRMGPDNLLFAQAEVQLTPNSILPSQQFVIGGGQSVRGFRQNSRLGDNGLRFSIEDRLTLHKNAAGLPVLQVAPFFDLGTVWNRSGNPNQLPSQRFLAGAGVGVIVSPAKGLTMRADYGVPLVNLSDRGDNSQDNGAYFSIGYNF
jgi:hemolysin activation/secretion protein